MVLFVFGCDAESQEEESPNTVPTAQDNPVTYTQNYQLNVKLMQIMQNGDNFSFTIVDEGSKGKLGNLNPTKTVT